MGYGKTDLSKMDMASHEMFTTFLAKTIQFEELGRVGGELLSRFHQELDLFRRKPLNETSQVLENIIQMNQTERLRTYTDAGCQHFHVAAQVTIKYTIVRVWLTLKCTDDFSTRSKRLFARAKEAH